MANSAPTLYPSRLTPRRRRYSLSAIITGLMIYAAGISFKMMNPDVLGGATNEVQRGEGSGARGYVHPRRS